MVMCPPKFTQVSPGRFPPPTLNVDSMARALTHIMGFPGAVVVVVSTYMDPLALQTQRKECAHPSIRRNARCLRGLWAWTCSHRWTHFLVLFNKSESDPGGQVK